MPAKLLAALGEKVTLTVQFAPTARVVPHADVSW